MTTAQHPTHDKRPAELPANCASQLRNFIDSYLKEEAACISDGTVFAIDVTDPDTMGEIAETALQLADETSNLMVSCDVIIRFWDAETDPAEGIPSCPPF